MHHCGSRPEIEVCCRTCFTQLWCSSRKIPCSPIRFARGLMTATNTLFVHAISLDSMQACAVPDADCFGCTGVNQVHVCTDDHVTSHLHLLATMPIRHVSKSALTCILFLVCAVQNQYLLVKWLETCGMCKQDCMESWQVTTGGCASGCKLIGRALPTLLVVA